MYVKKEEIRRIKKEDIRAIVTEAADEIYARSEINFKNELFQKIITYMRKESEEILVEAVSKILEVISFKSEE